MPPSKEISATRWAKFRTVVNMMAWRLCWVWIGLVGRARAAVPSDAPASAGGQVIGSALRNFPTLMIKRD